MAVFAVLKKAICKLATDQRLQAALKNLLVCCHG